MKSTKLLLIGAICSEQVSSLRMQLEAESQSQVQAQSEVVLDAESGTEVLNEVFLEAEAEQEAEMIVKQEQQLQEQEKTQESEKNKFIEIISQQDEDMFSEAETNAQKEVEDIKEKETKQFKPNIYENFDSVTGDKITEPAPQQVQSLVSAAAGDFKIETTEGLYNSFTPDKDADAYLAKLEQNPHTAAVVEQVKAKEQVQEQQKQEQIKAAKEASSLLKSYDSISEAEKAIADLKELAKPVLSGYDAREGQKEILIQNQKDDATQKISQTPSTTVLNAPKPNQAKPIKLDKYGKSLKDYIGNLENSKTNIEMPKESAQDQPIKSIKNLISNLDDSKTLITPVESDDQKKVDMVKKINPYPNSTAPMQSQPVKPVQAPVTTKPIQPVQAPVKSVQPVKTPDQASAAKAAVPIKSVQQIQSPTPAQPVQVPVLAKSVFQAGGTVKPVQPAQQPNQTPAPVAKSAVNAASVQASQDKMVFQQPGKQTVSLNPEQAATVKPQQQQNPVVSIDNEHPLANPNSVAGGATPKMIFDLKKGEPNAKENQTIKSVDSVQKQVDAHASEMANKIDATPDKKEEAPVGSRTNPISFKKMKQIDSSDLSSPQNKATQPVAKTSVIKKANVKKAAAKKSAGKLTKEVDISHKPVGLDHPADMSKKVEAKAKPEANAKPLQKKEAVKVPAKPESNASPVVGAPEQVKVGDKQKIPVPNQASAPSKVSIPAKIPVPAQAPANPTPEQVPAKAPTPAQAPAKAPPTQVPAKAPVPAQEPAKAPPAQVPAKAPVPAQAPAKAPPAQVPAKAPLPAQAPAKVSPAQVPAKAPLPAQAPVKPNAPTQAPAPAQAPVQPNPTQAPKQVIPKAEKTKPNTTPVVQKKVVDTKLKPVEKVKPGLGWSKKEAELEKESGVQQNEKQKPEEKEESISQKSESTHDDVDAKKEAAHKRLPTIIKAQMEGNQDQPSAPVAQPIQSLTKIPAQRGWSKLEEEQEQKMNATKEVEVDQKTEDNKLELKKSFDTVSTHMKIISDDKVKSQKRAEAYPAPPKQAQPEITIKVQKNKAMQVDVGSAPTAVFIVKDNSVPAQQNGDTQEIKNVLNLAKSAADDDLKKEEKCKKTTDNVEIKIDENIAPMAQGDKIPLTVFSQHKDQALGQSGQQQQVKVQNLMNDVVKDTSRNLSQIQTIHEKLMEQNKEFLEETDIENSEMPPVQIEKVQTQQEIQQPESKLQKQPMPEQEESGFKSFIRKWFKITW